MNTGKETDTDKFYRELLLSRSGAERLMMGFSMMDIAQKLIMSSLGKNTLKNLKKEIFIRLYEKDFSAQEKKIILQRF